MKQKSKSISALLMLGLSTALLLPGIAMSDYGAKYKVTITNLTPGQPFTPPVLVVHRRNTGVFTLGEPSSSEVQAIAENGNNGPLVAALSADPKVSQVVEGTAPLLPANDPADTGFPATASYTVHASHHSKFLSFISMLICTNDGFTGLDSVRLPQYTKTVYAVAYDARSEMNTEYLGDMVPPCQGLIGVTGDPGTGASNPLLAEDGIVIPHVGINGGADLVPGVHNWADPVAKIVITRIWR
ncbi:MAG: spondin domain-containing protein [Gammaproteobacteria bacterium]